MIPAAPHSAFKLWLLPPPFQGFLLIIAESHSAAGENELLLSTQAKSLSGLPLWVSTQWVIWGRGSSVILVSEKMCMALWHPYLSRCSQIRSDTSRISWCSRNFLTKIAMSTSTIDVHLSFFSYECVSFSYVCIHSVCAAPRLNAGVW